MLDENENVGLTDKQKADLTNITLAMASGISKCLTQFREEVLKKDHPELEPFMTDRNFRLALIHAFISEIKKNEVDCNNPVLSFRELLEVGVNAVTSALGCEPVQLKPMNEDEVDKMKAEFEKNRKTMN